MHAIIGGSYNCYFGENKLEDGGHRLSGGIGLEADCDMERMDNVKFNKQICTRKGDYPHFDSEFLFVGKWPQSFHGFAAYVRKLFEPGKIVVGHVIYNLLVKTRLEPYPIFSVQSRLYFNRFTVRKKGKYGEQDWCASIKQMDNHIIPCFHFPHMEPIFSYDWPLKNYIPVLDVQVIQKHQEKFLEDNIPTLVQALRESKK